MVKRHRGWILAGVLLVAACGGSGGDDGGNGGTGADGGPDGVCGYDQRFLPYAEGYTWTFRVTDLGTGEVTTKVQTITTETLDDLGEVFVQTTTKATGQTVSYLKLENDTVVRLRQEDYDQTGTLERTSNYDPGQNRLDESAARLEVGMSWEDDYSVTITDPSGVELSRTDRTDRWEVLGLDAACSSPLGDFECLHVRRQRTLGGVSDKQFFYSLGIGKVKEVNSAQVEELIACE